MLQLNKRLAALLAISISIVAISLSFFFKSYELAVGGLLITIVLTVFIHGWKSTLAAGLISMIAITALVIHFRSNEDITRALLSQVYSLLVIIFAVILVFYLKRLQQNLAHDRTHMISLFENATEGILLTDKEGKIVLVNPAAENMFGYLRQELTGHKIELLIPQRFLGGHENHREGFYKKPQNRSMGSGRDLFAKRKDGTEFPVEVSLSHYKQKSEAFVIAFIVDITTRKEIEQNLLRQKKELEKISDDIRELNAELEGKVEERTMILKEALQRLEQSQLELSESLSKEKQLNEIKSRFVSMASHEFRTPLSTILSSATLVSKYPNTEEQEQRSRHINRIRDSVNHMNELLEDFLSLGKLEEGKVGITITSFTVKEFIEDLLDEMKLQLKEGQEIILSCSGEPSFVTDKRMLKNILINLLGNAIKFSGAGKNVFMTVSIESDQLNILVKDLGVGIPEEDQPHLFTTFFRAKNVSAIQGTGLGLPIVKRYADLLKGEVSFISKIDEGTSFILQLPSLKELLSV
jgi:PAS domain S-box-containing protein